jgi:hypothetical protein
MPRPLTLSSDSMDNIKRETGSTDGMNFTRKPVLYDLIADNDHSLHRNGLRNMLLYSSTTYYELQS